MLIRHYKEEDKKTVISLLSDFWNYLVSLDYMKRLREFEGSGEKTFSETLKDMKERDGVFYVAEEEGEVIGLIAGVITKPDELDKSIDSELIGRITEFYVDPIYRGRGYGKLLMKEIENFFKVRGCKSVKVEVFAPNKNAHMLYQKLGYQERNVDMIKLI